MDQQTFKPNLVGNVMSTNMPTCLATQKVSDLLQILSEHVWDETHYAYVLDNNSKLLGQIDISQLFKAQADDLLDKVAKAVPETLSPYAERTKVVYVAVKNDIDAVPVVDEDNKLLGAITAKTIIDIMHNEHVESILLSTGIRRRKGANIAALATAHVGHVFLSRMPWLVVGGLAGIAIAFISSQFEATLEKSIALAYFIPVVAYIADSVGTQSEAITIRALAILKLNYLTYLMRELLVGLAVGIVLGSMGAIGAFVVSSSADVAVIVGLSLVTASTLAASLAALIPIIFKKLGKDPALGSGPLATALQDILSVLIYFLFAINLLK